MSEELRAAHAPIRGRASRRPPRPTGTRRLSSPDLRGTPGLTDRHARRGRRSASRVPSAAPEARERGTAAGTGDGPSTYGMSRSSPPCQGHQQGRRKEDPPSGNEAREGSFSASRRIRIGPPRGRKPERHGGEADGGANRGDCRVPEDLGDEIAHAGEVWRGEVTAIRARVTGELQFGDAIRNHRHANAAATREAKAASGEGGFGRSR